MKMMIVFVLIIKTGNLYDYINPKGEGYINPTGEGKSKDHPNDAKDDGYLQPQ